MINLDYFSKRACVYSGGRLSTDSRKLRGCDGMERIGIL